MPIMPEGRASRSAAALPLTPSRETDAPAIRHHRGVATATPVVAVIQDGARLHYALPIALQGEGLLGSMFTDWFVQPGSREEAIAALLRRPFPALGQRLAGRNCQDLDPARVVSSMWMALLAFLVRLTDQTPEAREARLSRLFGAWVGRQGWRGADCVMGFVRNIDARLCEAAHASGLATIVDQIIAPAEIEFAELQQQAERWPDWAPSEQSMRPRSLIALEQRTWQAADHITCPSAYVREGLLRQGIAPSRISQIPYPIAADSWGAVDRGARSGPVTVGFVGAVGLRKGAPAVLELARRFDPALVRFVMVGPLTAPPRALAAAVGKVVLTGPIARNAVRDQFRAFDIFLLPSSCEGSAGSVMEAMASALPVVTTPNAGSLVEDGEQGFIRDCRDLDGLTACVDRLVADPVLRTRMGQAGRRRVEHCGIDAYGQSLRTMLGAVLGWRSAATP